MHRRIPHMPLFMSACSSISERLLPKATVRLPLEAAEGNLVLHRGCAGRPLDRQLHLVYDFL